MIDPHFDDEFLFVSPPGGPVVSAEYLYVVVTPLPCPRRFAEQEVILDPNFGAADAPRRHQKGDDDGGRRRE
ncbi:MAG: hypothetical protein JNL96_03875 [Planctomycetaceae bacterium]|nr:hypothetical protein [Planctomycetaceae bacterium]